MKRIMLSAVLMLASVGAALAAQVGDMDNDDQVGLTEAIIALQVSAGIIPAANLGQYTAATGDAVPADVLKGRLFSNLDNAGLM